MHNSKNHLQVADIVVHHGQGDAHGQNRNRTENHGGVGHIGVHLVSRVALHLTDSTRCSNESSRRKNRLYSCRNYSSLATRQNQTVTTGW